MVTGGRINLRVDACRKRAAMRCPQCGSSNPEGAKFCNECGSKFPPGCHVCGKMNALDSKFCSECGHRLKSSPEKNPDISRGPVALPLPEVLPQPATMGHERRYATAFFTDLSGYTAISERLDPEEVKELMSRIFGQITKITAKYEGFVEKFVGDAALVLFGIPKAHEDDPVRAMWAAREIHEFVKTISPEMEKKIGHHLYMHTGITTGLVVTGEVNSETGSLGVLGDTINTASRLMSLAQPDEIIVGASTYHHCQGYFYFEHLSPLVVKGKAEPVQAFLLRAPREEPSKIRRLSGLRAELIGRWAEMDLLQDAAGRLMEGKGTVISISGEAGTGKSRLLEEFKATLDLMQVQWREGSAYQYAQKIPYFPLINLLNRDWQIREDDSPESIREKVESELCRLIKDREDLIPYVGSLYSLAYPELQGINPETWKSRLHEAVLTILQNDSRLAPTVICLEDLQWADPSSIDLLRLIVSQFRGQALFLLTYRPPFTLFTSHQLSPIRKTYLEIHLQDLSHTESQEMVQSLLKTKNIPPQLKVFMQELAEGNPFYLEEMTNALIETEILKREGDSWGLSRPITKSDLPSTIQEVISARLDRLEKHTKRLLQEASVIGRAFLYDVLQRVAISPENLGEHLSVLEHLDLIRVSAVQPDLEYVFKHALIQDAVYNGLLKKDRRAIHERIGQAMEKMFNHRLFEFYETLAFHFKHGQSGFKAVDYLIKSGEKSLERYALDEAHDYFKEAFDLLANKPRRSRQEDELFIDLISKWFLVFYYRGDFSSMVDLLSSNKGLAESLGDDSRLGMFYACLAFTLFWGQEKLRESYTLLQQAYALGEKVGSQRVIGYAATWLSWVCADLGLFSEGIRYGETAQAIAGQPPSDQYLYFKSLAGVGHNYWQMGDGKKDIIIGKTLQAFGRKYSNVRSIVTGHIVEAAGHFALGDFPLAIRCAKNGIEAAADPFYDQWAKIALSISFVFQTIKFAEAGELLEEVLSYSRESGCNYLKSMANLFIGVLLIAKGQMNRGLTMIEEVRRATLKNERVTLLVVTEYILGRIYLQIAHPDKPVSFPTIAKNLGFLVMKVPFAAKRAETHLLKAIEIAGRIGSHGILGQASLDLGLLKKKRGKADEARELIAQAINIFETMGAEVFLKIGRESLRTLG